MKMTTQLGFFFALVIACPLVSEAAITVNYSGRVLDASGSPAANGNEIRIGYFTPSFDIAGNAFNLSALDSAWHPFSSTALTFIGPLGGDGSFQGSPQGSDASFDGQKITLWAFKTEGGGAPLPDYTNVREQGIFSSTLSNWIFPAQDSILPTTTIGDFEANQNFFGGFFGGNLQLAPVPEPVTSALIAGLGLLGFAVYRRLKSE